MSALGSLSLRSLAHGHRRGVALAGWPAPDGDRRVLTAGVATRALRHARQRPHALIRRAGSACPRPVQGSDVVAWTARSRSVRRAFPGCRTVRCIASPTPCPARCREARSSTGLCAPAGTAPRRASVLSFAPQRASTTQRARRHPWRPCIAHWRRSFMRAWRGRPVSLAPSCVCRPWAASMPTLSGAAGSGASTPLAAVGWRASRQAPGSAPRPRRSRVQIASGQRPRRAPVSGGPVRCPRCAPAPWPPPMLRTGSPTSSTRALSLQAQLAPDDAFAQPTPGQGRSDLKRGKPKEGPPRANNNLGGTPCPRIRIHR